MTKLTVAAAARRLRKCLPPSFKRVKDSFSTSHPMYSDGRMMVEVRGACYWEAGKKDRGSCHATAIIARPTGEYRDSRLAQRTWRPRSDGTINWDAVATKIQLMIPTCDDIVAERKAHTKLCNDERLNAEKMKKLAATLVKRAGLPADCIASYGTTKLGEGVHLGVGATHQGINLNINYLSEELASQILDVVRSVGLAKEEVEA